MYSAISGSETIGRGYDVFGEYANNKSVKAPLFDFGQKMKAETWGQKQYEIPECIDFIPMGDTDYLHVYGKDIFEYYSSFNSTTKIAGKYGFFSGSVEVGFDKTLFQSREYEFVTVQNVVRAYRLRLPVHVRNMVLEEARQDIDAMDPVELFDNYGTHYLADIIIGGRLDYNCAVEKMTFKSESALTTVAEMSLKNAIGNISVTDSKTYKEQISKFNQRSITHTKTVGGLKILDVEGEPNARLYADWLKSIADQPRLIELPDVKSLIPIWTLVSEGKQKRTDDLKKAFREYAKQRSFGIEVKETKNFNVVSQTPSAVTPQSPFIKLKMKPWTVYRPIIETGSGWYWIGHYSGPEDGKTIILQETKPGSLAKPIDFQIVWTDAGSGFNWAWSLWKIVPPPRYVALGYLFLCRHSRTGWGKPQGPEIEGLRCVHEELVKKGKLNKTSIWDDIGFNTRAQTSVWKIESKDSAKSWDAGTFYAVKGRDFPKDPDGPYCLERVDEQKEDD